MRGGHDTHDNPIKSYNEKQVHWTKKNSIPCQGERVEIFYWMVLLLK